MKLWLIYEKGEVKRNERYIGFYREKCEAKNIDLKLVVLEDGLDFTDLPDAAVMRAGRWDISARLEKMGVKVFNNSQLSFVANDKWETYKYLSERGVKTLETYEVTEDFVPPFYPMVIKPRGGKGGKNVEIINSYDEFVNYRSRVSEKCIAQEVCSDVGKDVRVYVVGNKIIAAMLRSSEDDFRSNFCLGGNASRYELSPEEEETVKNVIRHFDTGFAGFDFIFDNGKMIFNEIEDAAGARMLYTHTDIDIVEIYLDFIRMVMKS